MIKHCTNIFYDVHMAGISVMGEGGRTVPPEHGVLTEYFQIEQSISFYLVYDAILYRTKL